jgi:hypothetical protein
MSDSEYFREYRRKNKDKLNAYNRKRKSNLSEEQRAAKQAWYRKWRKGVGRASYEASYHRRCQKIKTWFDEYKSTLFCQKCGENHPACLDFHHRVPNEKEEQVAILVGKRRSIQRIMKEIEKCDVLCANCHRKLHYDLNSTDLVSMPADSV